MTKEEFKTEWAKDDCQITFTDVANCAKAWGLISQPMTRPIDKVLKTVLDHLGLKEMKE